MAMASSRTTCAPSNISAASPTRMPRTARRRRRRRSSPTPSWRWDATISTASRIPRSRPDTDRAREMFSYAASYFGNADAQYDLARLYLKTPDASRDDFRYGARWLGLAAQKGQHQAQAMLGQMLFNGDRLPRQAARGLMWLTLARDNAAPDETWIRESYNRAFTKASDEDRAWRCRCSSTGCRARRTDGDSRIVAAVGWAKALCACPPSLRNRWRQWWARFALPTLQITVKRPSPSTSDSQSSCRTCLSAHRRRRHNQPTDRTDAPSRCLSACSGCCLAPPLWLRVRCSKARLTPRNRASGAT